MKLLRGLLAFVLIILLGGSMPWGDNYNNIDPGLIPSLDFEKVLLVERHAIKSTHVYTYHQEDNKPRGGLYLYDIKSRKLNKLVDSDQGLILDANLHYDGKTILFSWKKEMVGKFQLYTIKTDGSDLEQITDHPSNNFNACWLPNDEIAFLSDRKPAFAYCWSTTTPILYKCQPDGSK